MLHCKAILGRGQKANDMKIGMNYNPGAGSIAWPADLQYSALPLCYDCSYILSTNFIYLIMAWLSNTTQQAGYQYNIFIMIRDLYKGARPRTLQVQHFQEKRRISELKKASPGPVLTNFIYLVMAGLLKCHLSKQLQVIYIIISNNEWPLQRGWRKPRPHQYNIFG